MSPIGPQGTKRRAPIGLAWLLIAVAWLTGGCGVMIVGDLEDPHSIPVVLNPSAGTIELDSEVLHHFIQICAETSKSANDFQTCTKRRDFVFIMIDGDRKPTAVSDEKDCGKIYGVNTGAAIACNKQIKDAERLDILSIPTERIFGKDEVKFRILMNGDPDIRPIPITRPTRPKPKKGDESKDDSGSSDEDDEEESEGDSDDSRERAPKGPQPT